MLICHDRKIEELVNSNTNNYNLPAHDNTSVQLDRIPIRKYNGLTLLSHCMHSFFSMENCNT